jgi:hypothetical protein
MTIDDLKSKVQGIVKRANMLKDEYLGNNNSPVNYACVFSQSHEEYDQLTKLAETMGKVAMETPTGLLYQIKPLTTVAGNLRLLKIRLPDPTRPELGDADFTITDFDGFEKKYLSKTQFKRIQRENFYMIELMDSRYEVRAYFSNPPLDKQLGISGE